MAGAVACSKWNDGRRYERITELIVRMKILTITEAISLAASVLQKFFGEGPSVFPCNRESMATRLNLRTAGFENCTVRQSEMKDWPILSNCVSQTIQASLRDICSKTHSGIFAGQCRQDG